MNKAQYVKENVDIKTAIERYWRPIKNGKCACPFHDDKHPSMTIRNGKFRCWVCDARGDVIDFVSQHFGLGFQEAIDKLNDDFNLNLPRSRKLTTSQKHELSDNERLRREKDLKRELLESEIESLSEEHRVVFRASITWPFEYGRKLCAEHCDRLGEYIDNLILELDEL
jgi:DNA primase